jgi:predicted dinucleotide-binding enzyme
MDARRMTTETPIDAIGIIGAGHAGQAFARVAQRAGHEVVIANSRGPQSLAAVVEALGTGVSAGTAGEAAASAMVVIAVPWASVPKAVASLAWDGKIVIDQTNAFVFPDMKPADLGGRSSSEIVAELVEGARVVKAANTLGAGLLGSDPHEAGGRRVLFLSGDDGAAKAVVADLFEGAGFFPVDLGDLATGGRMQQAGGPLAGVNLVRLP